MKQLTSGLTYKTIGTLIMLFVIQAICWAQESGGSGSSGGGESSSGSVTHSTTTTTSNWYAQPWVWVIGAIALILLLVALLRGNSGGAAASASRTDKVTVSKTSSTDSDAV
ncbi:MAG: hypothetical protein H0X70_05250 [Segetibacter sp.]|nr:hypothetical protein [Segetibacter sp.]